MTGQIPDKISIFDKVTYGVAIFDNSLSPTSGWFSVGGAIVGQFADVSELSHDAIWWSNIPDKAFQSAGLSRSRSIRPASFLPLTPNHVLTEWGYEPMADARFTASFAAVVFGRIMRIAARLIDDVIRTHVGARPGRSQIFANRTLVEDFRPFLFVQNEANAPDSRATLPGNNKSHHWPSNPRHSGAMETLRMPLLNGCGAVQAIQILSLPIQSFLRDDATALSWSAGVVSEAIARAVREHSPFGHHFILHRKKDVLWNLDRLPLLADEQRKHLQSALLNLATA